VNASHVQAPGIGAAHRRGRRSTYITKPASGGLHNQAT
jgi:hypothetical protein